MQLTHRPPCVEVIYPITAHYFLGTRLLGTSRFNNPNCRPRSEVLVCTTCGETWGRIVVAASSWAVREVPCEKHVPLGVSDWGCIPGSFLQNSLHARMTSVMMWASVIEHLPPAVLARELEMAIRHYERKLSLIY